MLPLSDRTLRLVVLHHLALREAEGKGEDLHCAGLAAEQLAELRELSAVDLYRLAGMREVAIAISVDAVGLRAGLHTLASINESQALETYFLRHGASARMMHALFKMRHKVTRQRRRELGAWRPGGRFCLPDPPTRERIFQSWCELDEANPRLRYLRLHQSFPHFSLAVLETAVREFAPTEPARAPPSAGASRKERP